MKDYQVPLRIVFMVDDSSSTFNRGRSPGTDPQFFYRRDAITNFANHFGAKTNFTYAFGRFGREAASFYNFAGATSATPRYFGTAEELRQAVDAYVNSRDHGGDTPYRAAIQTTDHLIAYDASHSHDTADYQIVFLSDGAPTDLPDKTGLELEQQLSSLVGDAVATGRSYEHHVLFNTIYFGPEAGTVDRDLFFQADEAIANLQVMAVAGHGQFLDVNDLAPGQTLDIQDVVEHSVCNCQQSTFVKP